MPETTSMADSVSHYLENGKTKSNGIREIPKAVFVDRMKEHGVSEADYNRVQEAVNFETTAAARVAVADLEKKISEATPKELEDESYRKGLSATVRLPTFGGATEVEVYGEKHDRIPFRGDADGNSDEPQFKISHGRLRTTINAKARIHKDFHDEARAQVRKALKLKD